jgi:hypothetical protein
MNPKSTVTVKLSGTDGNAFAIIGAVSKALKKNGANDLAKQFVEESFVAGSYDELLQLVMQYVHVA